MNVKLDKVLERDIDLLLINSFIKGDSISSYIKSVLDVSEYKITDVQHSHFDMSGETDIRIILESNGKRCAVLIEDKIDAAPQPDQAERYYERAESGLKRGRYDEYKICIIAPSKYLALDEEAKKYPNRISYEELIRHTDDVFALELLIAAVDDTKNGFIPVEDPCVMQFLKQYYDFVYDNYTGKLKLNFANDPSDGSGILPQFRTDNKKIHIIHRPGKGYMDLTFEAMSQDRQKFRNIVGPVAERGMMIVSAGPAMVVRVHVPALDFNKSFDLQIDDVRTCLDAAIRLMDILSKLDIEEFY